MVIFVNQSPEGHINLVGLVVCCSDVGQRSVPCGTGCGKSGNWECGFGWSGELDSESVVKIIDVYTLKEGLGKFHTSGLNSRRLR